MATTCEAGKEPLRTTDLLTRLTFPPSKLATQFLRSPQAQEILGSIRDCWADQPKEEVLKLFVRHLRGRIFEEIASLYLKEESQSLGLKFLGASEVSTLYQRLHQNRLLINELYGLAKSIWGITIPDGLLLEDFGGEWHILKIFECKFGIKDRRREQFRYYLDRRMLGRDLKIHTLGSILPELWPKDFYPLRVSLSPRVEIILVVPQGTQLNSPDQETIPIRIREIVDLAGAMIGEGRRRIKP